MRGSLNRVAYRAPSLLKPPKYGNRYQACHRPLTQGDAPKQERGVGGKYASPPVDSSGLNRATRTRAIRALAVGCLAGGALFGWMWTLVGDRPTGLDRQAFAALATERGSFLAQAAKPLATIGPLLTGALVLVLIALLARRRRWLAATGIVVGYLLVALTALGAKAAEQRPRPAGALIDAGGYSFPSTESALAIGTASAPYDRPHALLFS